MTITVMIMAITMATRAMFITARVSRAFMFPA
ncbi:hypothetical protein ABID20_003356 [Rhizobium alvei]